MTDVVRSDGKDWTEKDFDDHLDSLSKRAEVLANETAGEAYQGSERIEILNKMIGLFEGAQETLLLKSAESDDFKDGYAAGIREELLGLIDEYQAI